MKYPFICMLLSLIIENFVGFSSNLSESPVLPTNDPITKEVTTTTTTTTPTTTDCPVLTVKPMVEFQECVDNCNQLCRVQRAVFQSRRSFLKKVNGCRKSCSRNRCRFLCPVLTLNSNFNFYFIHKLFLH